MPNCSAKDGHTEPEDRGTKKENVPFVPPNWQNLWKRLPSGLKKKLPLKLFTGIGRANVGLLLADGAIAAAVEAYCAGQCSKKCK